ncbi:MAG: dihydrodipicolinate synthase family protein [Clostridiaceae bacterium]|jgi:4-hydroxy-tetrahydrodipicolinate synthase|nr:dihydrodipicolinate synthase family protein [Clostridiaceae bacterium]
MTAFKPHGIIPPIVTPVTAAGRFDAAAQQRLIEHLLANGVHGIFPLGTTGEFYAFSPAETEQILAHAVKVCAGKVPVYAGANHITTQGAVEFCKIAEAVGADAVSVLTPMFISQTQAELFRHYETIAASTRLPVVLYNNKPKTNVTIEPETVARLAQIENIVAVKDSTGDMTNTAEYLRLTRHLPDFSVLLGRDTLIFAGLCHGAAGAIAATANVAPRLVVEIYEKYRSGDLAGALDAQFRLAPLRLAANLGTFPQAIKEGLNMLGFAIGKCVDPIAELEPAQKDKLRQVLRELGLIGQEDLGKAGTTRC